ncbi:MAG: ATP-binding cassette domain-containing protein [Lachnospiraceae bacterium]|nr:ATP-binding cassette domain-containing protein [Lachnospiraceae bacterium]
MEHKIVISHVTKRFKEYKALDDVSIKMESGKTYGIVGRNGSGKTVLFKCICGFLKLDEGKIWVDGKQIGKDIESPLDVGVIIETPGFLPGYSAYKNLKFLACIKNKIKKETILEMIQKVGLDPESKKHVGKYSMGMRQRLGIAQAIMEDPSLLILDEPMNGLDNQGVEDMRKLFQTLKKEGKTIVLASHNREDIITLCDCVIEMDRGRILSIKTDRLSADSIIPEKSL